MKKLIILISFVFVCIGTYSQITMRGFDNVLAIKHEIAKDINIQPYYKIIFLKEIEDSKCKFILYKVVSIDNLEKTEAFYVFMLDAYKNKHYYCFNKFESMSSENYNYSISNGIQSEQIRNIINNQIINYLLSN